MPTAARPTPAYEPRPLTFDGACDYAHHLVVLALDELRSGRWRKEASTEPTPYQLEVVGRARVALVQARAALEQATP